MPVVMLSTIQAEADKEYGDLKIAMTDAMVPDADGNPTEEPVDYVALRNGVRLSKAARDNVKTLRTRYAELQAEPEDVVEQRKKVNAAQNRLDGLREDATDRVRRTHETRLAEETEKLAELEAAHAAEAETPEGEARTEEKGRELRKLIGDMIRAVAVDQGQADRLIETTKTPDQPDGDLPYLMGIFSAYMSHGEVGEASPSGT